MTSTSQSETSNDAIFAVGLCYIAGPCLLFLISFVHPLVGWPLAAAIGWLLYKLLVGTKWRWTPAAYLPAAFVSTALVMIVGIPTGHSAYDWIKHWALINEIADHPWPVIVNLQGENTYLRYYLAGYLVPALIHKTIPAIPIVVPVTLWFFLGYMLVFRITAVMFGRRSPIVVAIGMVLTTMLGGADAFARHAIVACLSQSRFQYGWAGIMAGGHFLWDYFFSLYPN